MPASATDGSSSRRQSQKRVSIASAHFPIGNTGASRAASPGMSLKGSPSRLSTHKVVIAAGSSESQPDVTAAQKSEEKPQMRTTATISRFKRLRRPRLSIRAVNLDDLEHLMRKSPRRPSGSKEIVSPKVVIAAIACAAMTFAAFTGLASLLYSPGKPPDTQPAICKTEGCSSHATLLTYYLNRSIDPCDDFSAYVCSAWKRDSLRYELGESVLVNAVYTWVKNYGTMLREGALKLPAGVKPLFMYDACAAGESAYGRSVDKFVEVMQELGLSWPADSPPGRDAFGVLVNLAFNWEEVSWFRLTVSVEAVSRKRLLVLTPARMLVVNFQHHRHFRADMSYYAYWKSFYDLFNMNGTAPNKEAVREIARVEYDVLKNLMKAAGTQAKEPMSVPLRNISKYTNSISSYSWLTRINQYAPEGHEFTADDAVVSVEAFLLTVGKLLSTYSDQQLLKYFSWQFVQLFGLVSDQRLYLSRFLLRDRARIFRQVFCAFLTDGSYQQLASSLAYVSGFTDENRKLVNAGFENMITTAVSKIVASHSMNEDSKKSIVQKLNSLVLRLWPPSRYLNNSELEWRYKNFTTQEPTFGDYWANTRRSLSQVKKIGGFTYAAHGENTFIPPYLTYDPVTNSVSVALSVLTRPMYYKDGTKGMFYGGVGYLMALEIVEAFSTYVRRWKAGDDDAKTVSDAVRRAFAAQKACLKHRKVFPEIPALEIAYSAFTEALANASQRLEVREDLPEEKVVFMTLCYISCMQVDVFNAPVADCNVAVKNFPPFAKAFDCPKGSAMNPHEQCVFFQ